MYFSAKEALNRKISIMPIKKRIHKNIYPERKRSWRDILLQSVFLFIFWLLLSGHYDLFHISLGIISIAIVQVLNMNINRIQFFKGDIPEWERLHYGKLVRYLFWLLWQIVVSALQVAYVVLHPRMPINPAIVRFKARMPNVGAAVILGNSITLTPGTITILIESDEFTVHALMDESYAGLTDGTMPKKVARIFRSSTGEIVSDVHIIRSHNKLF